MRPILSTQTAAAHHPDGQDVTGVGQTDEETVTARDCG